MKPDGSVTSSDILESLELQVLIRVPRRVARIVAARLWLASQIVRLAALVGGLSIAVDQAEESDGQG